MEMSTFCVIHYNIYIYGILIRAKPKVLNLLNYSQLHKYLYERTLNEVQ